MVKLSSIKDFFKPYAAPKQTNTDHDKTRRLSRRIGEQKPKSKSDILKQNVPSSATSPISPPRRRTPILKDLVQPDDSGASTTMNSSKMDEDTTSDDDILHIVIPSSNKNNGGTTKSQTPAIDADVEMTGPDPEPANETETPDENAQNTVRSSTGHRTQDDDGSTAVNGSSAANKVISDDALRMNEKQTPHESNESASKDNSASPLSPMPSHLSTPLALRSIQKSQRQALNDLPTLKDPVFTTETLPPASQKISNLSFSSNTSHRTVIDGMNAVTNSDSDEDALSTSSDDGLLDLNDIIPRKRRKITPERMDAASSCIPALNETNCNSASRVRPRPQTKVYRPAVKVYKNSLADMAKQMNQENANAERRKLAEAHVESIHTVTPITADLDVVATDLASDQEDRDRLKAAMLRMEVISSSDIFYFFGKEYGGHPPEWPLINSTSRWSFLNDSGSRSQAFLTGFVTEMLSFEPLPQENLHYICRSLLHEHDELLCHRYMQVLTQAIQKQPTVLSQDVCSLQALYQGCTKLDQTTAVEAALPRSVKHALSLLGVLSKSMTSTEQLSSVVFEMILLNVDQHVSEAIDLRLCIGRALEAIFASEHMHKAVSATIDKFLKQELLTETQCCRAINSLPVLTTAVHRFRRQLAVHYILNVDAEELVELDALDSGTRLLVKLKRDPQFKGDDDTDWSLFLELMKVLDIAFDAGFSKFHFLGDSPSVKLSGKQSQSELDFNAQIDAVTKQLRIVSNRIKDAGTSHLRRTEAKHALNAVIMRLESCVRTRPMRKAGIFGGWDDNTLHDFLFSAAQHEV